MAWTRVASVAEMPAGRGKQVQVAGKTIALFLSDNQVYAIDDTCPHRGASLSEGQCRGDQVMCPWHSARFDLKTGQALCPPARSGVTAYPARIDGDDVQVDI